MNLQRRLARLEANRQGARQDPEVEARVARYTQLFEDLATRQQSGEVYRRPTTEEEERDREEFHAQLRYLRMREGQYGGRGLTWR